MKGAAYKILIVVIASLILAACAGGGGPRVSYDVGMMDMGGFDF